MEDKPIINIVASQCHPDDEEKFNQWYNEIHIPLLLKLKGLTEVTRYKIVNDTGEYPRYLTIYKYGSQKTYETAITSPEFAAAMDEMKETWKARDYERKWRVQYEFVKCWGK